MRTVLALCALMLSTIAAPASAAVIFNVAGVFGTPGGTLTGTFTTNDAITLVTAVDLTSSANGGFQSFHYNDVSKVDAQFLPSFFRITVTGANTEQLQITFSPALSLAGSAIGANSFEHQDFPNSGNRTLTGAVTHAAAGAVPEPAAWALMIGGFGFAGAALRRRRALSATT